MGFRKENLGLPQRRRWRGESGRRKEEALGDNKAEKGRERGVGEGRGGMKRESETERDRRNGDS